MTNVAPISCRKARCCRWTLVRPIKAKKLASLDGDADRLVYYYIDQAGTFKLLDGDKIIALFVTFIQSLVKASQVDLSIGVVQTAYANGASTIYIAQALGVPVQCAKTGVKHLHHVAAEYDIGVYFEANGHGTVLIGDAAVQKLQQAIKAPGVSTVAKHAAERLLCLALLINQAVGDALSDLLLVEVALSENGWSLVDWNNLYQDLPSRMIKVAVPDRSVVRTANAERTCTNPKGLQAAINVLVGDSAIRRSFVRPSGTEDVVRVYAEAETQKEADDLADAVGKAVQRFCKE